MHWRLARRCSCVTVELQDAVARLCEQSSAGQCGVVAEATSRIVGYCRQKDLDRGHLVRRGIHGHKDAEVHL